MVRAALLLPTALLVATPPRAHAQQLDTAALAGDNPEYRLIPMAEDLFALEGLETFRIRFVTDGTGPAAAVVGLSFDGDTDRTDRSR